MYPERDGFLCYPGVTPVVAFAFDVFVNYEPALPLGVEDRNRVELTVVCSGPLEKVIPPSSRGGVVRRAVERAEALYEARQEIRQLSEVHV